MPNDRISELIARKLSREATAEELQELSAHMQINPADQYFEELIAAYWNSKNDQRTSEFAHNDSRFNHILELAASDSAANEPPPLIRQNRSIALAKKLAIAALVAGLAWATWLFIPHEKSPTVFKSRENEVVARKGVRSKLVLPDSTEVWLNSDSRLLYGNNFNDTIREVTLEGEAYFIVTKDAKRPFIVRTSGIDIRVLGTAFNVKSYSSEPTIEATLIHGMIEVRKKNQPDAPRMMLRPHEKIIFKKYDDVTVEKQTTVANKEITDPTAALSIVPLPKNIHDTSIVETSWVYNKLLFEEKFSELALKMERWFNVKISFNDQKVANYKLRGSFVNETVEEALQALQLSVSFNYKIEGDEIIIDRK